MKCSATTVKILKIWIQEKMAVIILKNEQSSFTMEKCIQKALGLPQEPAVLSPFKRCISLLSRYEAYETCNGTFGSTDNLFSWITKVHRSTCISAVWSQFALGHWLTKGRSSKDFDQNGRCTSWSEYMLDAYEPPHQKTCLRDLWPVKTQTGLLSWWK